MTVNSSANSVILILFAFSDNLSAENSKSSADSCNPVNHLFGCMSICYLPTYPGGLVVPLLIIFALRETVVLLPNFAKS